MSFLKTNSMKTFGNFNNERIILNVSGRKYECWRSTLSKYPDTLLGSFMIEDFYDKKANAYILNRDPILFRYILDFYRTGRIHMPKACQENREDICLKAFAQELSFFIINHDYVSKCCALEFFEKLGNYIEVKITSSDISLTKRQKLWLALKKPNESKPCALVFNYITLIFIALSVVANIVETIPVNTSSKIKENQTLGRKYQHVFFGIDTACVIIFFFEYLLRLYATPSRLTFFKSFMNIVDLLAIFPYAISVLLIYDYDGHKYISHAFINLKVLRAFRVLKISRYFRGLMLFGKAIKQSANELITLTGLLLIFAIFFGTVMFHLERDEKDTKFKNIPNGIWYTIVTMTTIGYGDIVPKTVSGKLIGGFCSLTGVLVIALPVPVVVSNFSRIVAKHRFKYFTK